MPVDPILLAERAHLDHARSCLTAMLTRAAAIADYGVDELASQSLGRLRAERLRSLGADPSAPPFFGRIDRDADRDALVEVFHIGRRHVRDADGDPVVIDWRAPVARAFYRATATEPMGVHLRRRFGFRQTVDGPELTSFEDEQLDLGEALGLDSELLREEIERPRVGPMRDIVATIQPDQDDLVRADLDTSLCIQGAPGTGKTAVGLHRAAYLLYTFPERLRRSGVLVVGPNRAFLHYIAQVLPSLGEGGIEQSTVDELVGGPARGTDPVVTAVVKGDARMAEVLRNAVLAQIAKPVEDVVAVVGTKRYRVGAHHLRRYVDDARRALADGLKWSPARDRLRMQIAEDVRRQREDAGGAPTDADTTRVARARGVGVFLDEVWPTLTPAGVLGRLYGDPEYLRRCSANVLTDDERRLLARPEGHPSRTSSWTPADVVLLDELTGLIEGVDTYVHVVLDEAQDLSAMQCRAIARRCPLGSVTVLGDLAQATTPWAVGDWTSTLHHLGHATAAVRPLTSGYRVPGEVLELANRLLAYTAPTVSPATSVRHGADALRLVPGGSAAEEVRRCLDAEGSVGVIVADYAVASTLRLLSAAGVLAEDLDADADARVSVVPASEAKGLEFDSVVLLEPAAIVAAEPSRPVGLRRLYVVLTRAVSRLAVVHGDPLPPELAACGSQPDFDLGVVADS